MIKLSLQSLDKIDEVAVRLLKELKGRKKVAFSGEMGAGKTTMIQALCRVLGVDQVVTSPTFALINEYYTADGEAVFHFDLYRIEDISELYDIGYEDYWYSDAWCFVEWPEKAEELIPDDFVFLRIDVQEDGSRALSASLG